MFHMRTVVFRVARSSYLRGSLRVQSYYGRSQPSRYSDDDRYDQPRYRRENTSYGRPREYRNEEEVDLEELESLEGIAREREVITNVYKESLTTSVRTQEEIQAFMDEHRVTVEGSPPKPILTIAEAEVFPKPIKDQFAQAKITTPTAIQSMCWPMAMSGSDMIGIAQTGSGKTLGYLLPAALHIGAQPQTDLKGPTALVLAPTRELVQQISTVAQRWLSYTLGIKNVSVYGGASKLVQVTDLKRGAQLCVATPGRLNDILNSRVASLANSSLLVLDEADRMLDMGFEPQIREIIDRMRKDRQTVMFSATWPKDVRQLAADFMRGDTLRVNIGSTELCANSDIRQEIRFVEESQKRPMLLEIVKSRPGDKILIFAGTKRTVSMICNELVRFGVRCVESHGDLSQAKRERALENFQGRSNVMVATDVAARGLDVRNINLVINFDFPQTVEDYVHRIGRTGRSGCKGEAITFFTRNNESFARGLINVLTQAGQEVPEELRRIEHNSSHHEQSFRRKIESKKTFNRMNVSSDWRRAARVR